MLELKRSLRVGDGLTMVIDIMAIAAICVAYGEYVRRLVGVPQHVSAVLVVDT